MNTCAAASSAVPKGYARTTGSAPETDSFWSHVTSEQPLISEKSAPSALRTSLLESPFPISFSRTQENELSTAEEDIAAELALAMSAGGTEVASFIASCVQPNNNFAAIVSVKQVRAIFICMCFPFPSD